MREEFLVIIVGLIVCSALLLLLHWFLARSELGRKILSVFGDIVIITGVIWVLSIPLCTLYQSYQITEDLGVQTFVPKQPVKRYRSTGKSSSYFYDVFYTYEEYKFYIGHKYLPDAQDTIRDGSLERHIYLVSNNALVELVIGEEDYILLEIEESLSDYRWEAFKRFGAICIIIIAVVLYLQHLKKKDELENKPISRTELMALLEQEQLEKKADSFK